ncbi:MULTISPECIES: hypothetical protein [Mycolicibacter]|uniref:Uncharacterized protein n=1 Tax=Mycolicibacter longobardus TaxID=1108812 RepID=A0A1X1YBT1_9MYCO|nr:MULTISPECIES: hypothetical protein [Mycolicibacter]ORW08515.1 hypothetical protein AWC16_19140 [Mycolicibacter longobardus]RAV04374.1 hypothetical protein DQP56_00720 [Mycolicibacter senuensis]
MKAFRVFNDVDQVDVEWTILGLRWRMPSMICLIGALLFGVIVTRAVSYWVGVPIGVLGALLVIRLVGAVNAMDPGGHLHEFTQLGLLLRTWARPVIDNSGRR